MPKYLLHPLDWKRPHQHLRRSSLRLPPVGDGLDALRRQQHQPKHSAHVRQVNSLDRGQVRQARVVPLLQHPLPTVCLGECLDERPSMRSRVRLLAPPDVITASARRASSRGLGRAELQCPDRGGSLVVDAHT